jgi:hypothetical protein
MKLRDVQAMTQLDPAERERVRRFFSQCEELWGPGCAISIKTIPSSTEKRR